MLKAMDNRIGKAIKVLNFLSSYPDTVRVAELREKAIWDEVSRMNGAKAEGIQHGPINTARRMLDVAGVTGLSVEEVYWRRIKCKMMF